ncbi:MAG: carbamoyltransferase HypF, partial [Deltaproteobacteria bacterium]
LAVDAFNHEAVQRLRERKKRDEKPFAVMASNLEKARKLAKMDVMEERLLVANEAPIVIVKKDPNSTVSPQVSPKNGWLGLILPYTPIHHLLASEFNALVMTSANISDEPICCEEEDALQRLSGIADYYLSHSRRIHIREDDSVLRAFQGRPLFYRRARGYAPRAVGLPFQISPILAVGAELKSAVCIAQGGSAFLSQHIGDLQNIATFDSFRHTIEHLCGLLEIKPTAVACDLHPDYMSTVYAGELGLPVTPVQHHHAHMAACMAENGLEGEAIGIIFDGTGLGSDGNIWGGEFIVGGYDGLSRAGHFRTLPLPGGDVAVREPWRMALSYLYQVLGAQSLKLDLPVVRCLSESEKSLFTVMLEKGLNSPLTSSCGRLFDAVAALLNIRHVVSYDGQAAMEMEALAENVEDERVYPFDIISHEGEPFQIDFSVMFPELLSDLAAEVPTAVMARRFHSTVAAASIQAAFRIKLEFGIDRVVISGGVFQNRLLSEMVYNGLTKIGLQVFTHRLTPPNDGCIALGQAAVAGWQRKV